MSTERSLVLDEPTQDALEELKRLISQRYPGATFEVAEGEDPEGIYLLATVDVEDVEEVLDAVLDQLFTIQVERGLPIYVIPLEPLERVLRESRAPRRPARPRIDSGAVSSPAR